VTTVRYTDGVELALADGRRVVADADRPEGDVNVLSHAHGDHLYGEPPGPLVCSELTAALAGVRRDSRPERTSHPDVELFDAGHIPGSRAALVTDRETGQRVLYTGDCSTRDRFYLSGFEPPSADVLVLEATYGEPASVFPPQAELERRIVDWFEATGDRPVLCMGYSLGRAQEIQLLARRAGRRVLVSDAIADLNAVIEAHLDVDFGATRHDADTDLEAGDVLVLPTQTNHLDFVDAIRERTGALKAGFSGWAVDSGFRYQGDYDETFVLSDHCDHSELLDVVRAVDPEQVYVQHGSADAFASSLTRTTDYPAQSLQPNQTSLGEF